MGDEAQSRSLASAIGADALSAIVHDASRGYLTRVLSEQPAIELPDLSKAVAHDRYERLREQIAKAAALAAMASDARLEALLQQWIQLQQGYAKQVIAEVKGGVVEQRSLLELADTELIAGQKDRDYFETLRRSAIGELGDDRIAQYQALKARIAKLDETARTREELHRAVAGVSRVEQTLTALIDSAAECIHYRIPSGREIQERLGKNAYDGPDFQPFLVSNRVIVRDIFARNMVTPSMRSTNGGAKRKLDMTDLHPVLSELVKIYTYIMDMSPGASVIPSNIVTFLKLELIGAKGLASYLEDNEAVFGVQQAERRGGSRTFIRKASETGRDNQGFLEYMVDGRLQQADAKQVNEHYFARALILLRERPEAYTTGFTREDAKTIAANNGLPIGRLYIPRTITTSASEIGLKPLLSDGTDVERYVFLKVMPTDNQVRYVLEAVGAFGISRFSPDDAARKVLDLHRDYRILEKVVAVVLHEHHAGWGLRVASNDPLQYQKGQAARSSSPARRTPPGRLM